MKAQTAATRDRVHAYRLAHPESTYREIAEALDLSLTTVHHHMTTEPRHALIKRLTELLWDCDRRLLELGDTTSHPLRYRIYRAVGQRPETE